MLINFGVAVGYKRRSFQDQRIPVV